MGTRNQMILKKLHFWNQHFSQPVAPPKKREDHDDGDEEIFIRWVPGVLLRGAYEGKNYQRQDH